MGNVLGGSAAYTAVANDSPTELNAAVAANSAALAEVDSFGWTLLHWAAWQGKTAALRRLLESGDVSVAAATTGGYLAMEATRREAGLQALHLAARAFSEGAIRLLCAAHADVNARSGGGYTPLGYVSRGGHSDSGACVEALLRAGARVGDGGPSGASPLHLAAVSADTMRPLLAARAHVAAVDDKGRTPLMLAAKGGSVACVTMLLAAGASADTLSRKGRSALGGAVRKACAPVVAVLLPVTRPELHETAFTAAVAVLAKDVARPRLDTLTAFLVSPVRAVSLPAASAAAVSVAQMQTVAASASERLSTDLARERAELQAAERARAIRMCRPVVTESEREAMKREDAVISRRKTTIDVMEEKLRDVQARLVAYPVILTSLRSYCNALRAATAAVAVQTPSSGPSSVSAAPVAQPGPPPRAQPPAPSSNAGASPGSGSAPVSGRGPIPSGGAALEGAPQNLCSICEDRDRDTALTCGHILCASCAQWVRSMSPPLCPHCRSYVTGSMRVYL